MAEFRVPRRELRFLIHDLFDFERHYARLEGVEPVERELIDAVLDEAAKFAETELFPLNRSGDEAGCRLENGTVTTPPGFKEAYRTYLQAGWSSMSAPAAHGGQGLPPSLWLFVSEMFTAANMSWTMYLGLSHGARMAIEAHGTDEQKRDYLMPLVSGTWAGTMCLTEPHAGSDVGLLRTRAEPRADGSYTLTGTKIFISAGEHDLTENIVHLVLARLPEAPAGTKGISLFIVPKYLPGADGGSGERNGVVCSAIEEKMGIHGNATCVLNFDGATGYLLGGENKGMRCMFTMMNAARLAVGMQGLGITEAAYQASLDYARERLQMRALAGPVNADAAADPIIVHPDVRRMLLTQKAIAEGGRALTYYTGQQVDLVTHGASAEARAEAQARLDFLTPVVKGFLTEIGCECASHAIQIFGGHGFIRETGVEQQLRDCRITTIYEGTTQIQALDLLGRKVLMTEGRALALETQDMRALAQSLAENSAETLTPIGAELERIADEWQTMTQQIGGEAAQDPTAVGAAAVDYLIYSGYALLARCWAHMALAAQRACENEDDAFLRGKIATAEFYFRRLLPRAEAHRRAIVAGTASLMGIEDAGFDHH